MTHTADVDTNPCHLMLQNCVMRQVRRAIGEVVTEPTCMAHRLVKRRTYDAHEVLFREREASSHLFVLQYGLLKFTSLGPSGQEQIIGLGMPGRLFGFDSLLDKHYRYTAESISPVTVCAIKHSCMLNLLEHNTAVSVGVIELLNRELVEAHELIRVLGQKSAEERVAWLILFMRTAIVGDAPGSIPIQLSRKEISELLGLTPETVSRFTAEFRRQGLIDTSRGFIRILDLARLRAVADSTKAAHRFQDTDVTT